MLNELIKIRGDLHQIPELGRQEFETKGYILDYVQNFKCQIFLPTKTAVVLYFDASKKDTICFRADMDALQIKEENDVCYKSKHEGLMHACGHDGHMAMLLGFAKYANDNLDKLTSNIVCLFQPSEEDRAGATDILKSGILDELNVKQIFGFHIWPTLPEGRLYTMPLGMLATSGEVNVNILGLSSHAANRASGRDALLAGVKFVSNIYDRMANITDRHLISFGKFNSGNVRNTVSSNCHIEATMRSFADDVFARMKDILFNTAKEIENELGVKFNIEVNALYPSVINDIDLVSYFKDYLNLNILDEPFLQAEDFGCYTRSYKSLFMLIGAGDKHLLHTSSFDFNPKILEVGYNTYIKIATKEKI